MKAIYKLLSIFSIITVGTVVAVAAENAISNDISKFKGKSFEEVYKDGQWKVRFFRTDFDIKLFKEGKLAGFEQYEGLDGDKECEVNSGQTGFYWLTEVNQDIFEKSINNMKNDSSAKHLLLVEFNKKGDWFGRSTTYAWFGFNGKGSSEKNKNLESRRKQILEILKSNQSTPSPKTFAFLKDTESKTQENIGHLYVHDRLLLSPLKLKMEKQGNCGKWIIPKEHITTI